MSKLYLIPPYDAIIQYYVGKAMGRREWFSVAQVPDRTKNGNLHIFKQFWTIL